MEGTPGTTIPPRLGSRDVKEFLDPAHIAAADHNFALRLVFHL